MAFLNSFMDFYSTRCGKAEQKAKAECDAEAKEQHQKKSKKKNATPTAIEEPTVPSDQKEQEEKPEEEKKGAVAKIATGQGVMDSVVQKAMAGMYQKMEAKM